jgi:outer membrane protein TolC
MLCRTLAVVALLLVVPAPTVSAQTVSAQTVSAQTVSAQTVSAQTVFAQTVFAQTSSAAQTSPPTTASTGRPFLGGVPSGVATAAPIVVTVAQAIYRALEHNLGVLLAEQDTAAAAGGRWDALSRLLPNVSASVTESRRKSNLEAFGFPLGPSFPRIVGPFNVFDARISLSQTLIDASAVNESSAASHRLAAARHTARGARETVILVAANLYLQALATQARAEAASAQLATAQAIHQQALDLRQAGIIAGLDVVRAEVRMSTDRQRATAAANDAEKAKLQLARVIGLPIGQAFTLVDDIPPLPDPSQTLEQTLTQAYAQRADYLAAIERLRAAESMRKAAAAERLPSVRVTADYGTLGLSAGSALPTFNLTGAVDVPIFDGGRQLGHLAEADAALRQRRAEVEDLRAGIYYDVRTAFLDLEATQQELQTATRGRELANQQLQQSRDRFAAGVASNIEVVQAQEAVALASEQAISARYGFSIAKALLAQSAGSAEAALRKYLGDPTP